MRKKKSRNKAGKRTTRRSQQTGRVESTPHSRGPSIHIPWEQRREPHPQFRALGDAAGMTFIDKGSKEKRTDRRRKAGLPPK